MYKYLETGNHVTTVQLKTNK